MIPAKAKPSLRCRFFRHTYRGQRWSCKNDCWYGVVLRRQVIALQQVVGDDFAVVPSHRRKRHAICCRRVTSGINRRICDALKVIIDLDALLLAFNVCSLKIKVVDVWYAPGCMHCKIATE